MSNEDKNQNSRAWVWSQYRGEQPGGAEPTAATRAGASPDTRERPPLVPQKSAAGAGPLLAGLILIVAGLTWYFSSVKPTATPDAAPQEAATPAPEPAAETPPPADAAAPPPDAAPSDSAPPAATSPEAAPPEAKPEPKPEEKPAAKGKKKRGSKR